MREITTSIEIDAPPERVWDILTDFERYPEWNPFLSVTGQPVEGARLTVVITPPGKTTTTFHPEVLTAEPERKLRWLGRLELGNFVVPKLFDGDHRFQCESLGEGRTQFTQSERFTGVLVPPLLRWFGSATEQGFKEMNQALKTRAEAASE